MKNFFKSDYAWGVIVQIRSHRKTITTRISVIIRWLLWFLFQSLCMVWLITTELIRTCAQSDGFLLVPVRLSRSYSHATRTQFKVQHSSSNVSVRAADILHVQYSETQTVIRSSFHTYSVCVIYFVLFIIKICGVWANAAVCRDSSLL